MAQNDEQAFFVDDELVERLMRGDSPANKAKKQRPAETSALGNAVKLAAAGRLDEAVKARGDDSWGNAGDFDYSAGACAAAAGSFWPPPMRIASFRRTT